MDLILGVFKDLPATAFLNPDDFIEPVLMQRLNIWLINRNTSNSVFSLGN
ncbi:MAG: hypothetical protein WKF87_09360 [Chryseolinea sp.]